MPESDGDPLDLNDLIDSTGSQFYRTTDRDCDCCGSSEGSVTVDRETDTARCRKCYNDPSTWDEDDDS